jgi:hypothetical protein
MTQPFSGINKNSTEHAYKFDQSNTTIKLDNIKKFFSEDLNI